MPAIAGFIITAGEPLGLYSIQFGYGLIFVVSFILFLMSSMTLLKSNISDVTTRRVTVPNPSAAWNYNRLYYFVYDALFGVMLFLPSILILERVGDESVLGVLNAIAALLALLVVYVIARKAHISQALRISTVAVVLFMMGASGLIIFPGAVMVFIFLMISRVVGSVRSAVGYPVSMELMDDEHGNQYAYVCDNELFYNIGRVAGIGLFGLILWYFSTELALSWIAVILGLLQVVSLYPFAKMIQAVQSNIR